MASARSAQKKSIRSITRTKLDNPRFRFHNKIMKKTLTITAVILLLASCAPVLNKDLMREGRRNVSLDELRANPDAYKGKLFILGGLIVETRLSDKGSQVEVLSVSVDSRGYLEDSRGAGGRFLALYPQSRGLLDPLVFKKGREVTLAGEFLDTRKAKIDEMEYVYPVFDIKQVYLWEDQMQYYSTYPYPAYPYPYWYGSPWWGPWPPPPGWW